MLSVAYYQWRSKKNMTSIFFIQCIIKRLLQVDSVVVISRIIKVSLRVVSLSLWLWLITPTSTSSILDVAGTSFNNCLLLYIELTISFRIGWKHTVNFQNQQLWCHLAADYTIIMSIQGHSRSRVIMSCITVVHDF